MSSPAPKIALALGWGGVLPFIGAAAVKAWGSPVMAILALSVGTIYAGVIICFIGALHWGAVVYNREPQNHHAWRYIWSVVPALAVVPILILAPQWRIPFLIIGLLICWGVDFYAYRKGLWPKWFMQLRHGLTSVAVLSLIIIYSV